MENWSSKVSAGSFFFLFMISLRDADGDNFNRRGDMLSFLWHEVMVPVLLKLMSKTNLKLFYQTTSCIFTLSLIFL